LYSLATMAKRGADTASSFGGRVGSLFDMVLYDRNAGRIAIRENDPSCAFSS